MANRSMDYAKYRNCNYDYVIMEFVFGATLDTQKNYLKFKDKRVGLLW